MPPPGKSQVMKRAFLSSVVFLIVLFAVSITYAEQENKEKTQCPFIYGHYWQSQRWGWYGAKRVVRTPVEAKEIVEQFVQNKGIKVVRIRALADFFVAEIIDRNGVVVDRILIDRRTGRARSMY